MMHLMHVAVGQNAPSCAVISRKYEIVLRGIIGALGSLTRVVSPFSDPDAPCESPP